LAIRAARPQTKPFKVYDGKGLFLLVRPNGSRLWRFKYSHGGVEKLLSLGAYPEISLKRARTKRDEARSLVADAIDPSAKRKAEKSARAETFAALAEEWLQTKKATLTEGTWQRDRDQLVKLVGPYLGKRPIAAIEARELLEILKRLEKRGVRDTAHRVRASAGGFFATPSRQAAQSAISARTSRARSLPRRRNATLLLSNPPKSATHARHR